jgi:hypothetical protein
MVYSHSPSAAPKPRQAMSVSAPYIQRRLRIFLSFVAGEQPFARELLDDATCIRTRVGLLR